LATVAPDDGLDSANFFFPNLQFDERAASRVSATTQGHKDATQFPCPLLVPATKSRIGAALNYIG
jgi:hypothetical protein